MRDRAPSRKLSGEIVDERRSSVGRIFIRRLPAAMRLGCHAHDASILTIVTGGRFSEQLGGKDQDCRPGDVRLLPAGDVHTNAVRTTSECVQIEISQRVLDRAADLTGPLSTCGRLDGDLVGVLGARLVHECRRSDDCSPVALEALTLDLLSDAGRRAILSHAKRPEWLDRVRALIRDTCSNPVSLAGLAADAGVHPVHLSREFHRRYGCTIGEAIRRLRVRGACELMRNPRLTLTAVAQEAGFSDHSHLVKAFRQYLWITPGGYRRLVSGDRTAPGLRQRTVAEGDLE